MKHIKSINELFDSDDLKGKMEIDFLKGNLNKKDIVSSIGNFKKFNIVADIFQKIHYNLSSKFTFFNAPVNAYKRSKIVENKPNLFAYIFIHDNWYIQFAIRESLKNKYDVVLQLKTLNTISSEYVIGINNFEPGKMAIEALRDVDIQNVFELIEDTMIPLMRNLGFDDYLNYTEVFLPKEWSN